MGEVQPMRRRSRPAPTTEQILMKKLVDDVSLCQTQMANLATSMGEQSEAMHSIKNAVQGIPFLVKRLDDIETALQAAEKKDLKQAGEREAFQFLIRLGPWVLGLALAAAAWVLGKKV